VEDRVGRPCEEGQLGVIDPQARLIGLHLYDGLFKVRAVSLSTKDCPSCRIKAQCLYVMNASKFTIETIEAYHVSNVVNRTAVSKICLW
jgi:hypothetical protein